MEIERYVATENMKKFFDKLTKLKKFVKKKVDETGDEDIIEIYDRLDEIFKIKEKK